MAIRKTKRGFEVKDKAGKRTLGIHATKAAAQRQLRAIEANKRKR